METVKIYMKTILILLAIGLAGCGKESSSSNSAYTTTTGYYWSNNYCYSSYTGQIVNSTYCGSTGLSNDLFQYSGSSCIYVPTGQTSDSSYCSAGAFTYNTSGQCIDNVQGSVVVESTFCANLTSTYSTTSTSYYWNGAYCYSSSTGLQVATTYCSSTSSSSTGSTCYGTYYYYYYYQFMPVSCTGANCSGYTLYDYNGQSVYCQ